MVATLMKRRRLVTGAVALFAIRMSVDRATAVAALPGRAGRVGGLVFRRERAGRHLRRRVETHLHSLGHRAPEGVEYRWRFGDLSEGLLSARAAEPVRGLPDVLFGWGNASTTALARATNRIPIVGLVSDPVRPGLSKSAVRPSGNVTGQMDNYGTTDKIMDLARRVVPRGAAIAIVHPGQSTDAPLLAVQLERAARDADMEPLVQQVANRAESGAAFRSFRGQGATAAIIPYWFLPFEDARALVQPALDCGTALVDPIQSIAGVGALLTYHADYGEVMRRMAIPPDLLLLADKVHD